MLFRSQLEEILDMERSTINEWVNKKEDPDGSNQFMNELMQDLEDSLQTDRPSQDDSSDNFSNQLLGNIGEQNKEFIKNLPEDTAGKVKALQEYEFLNTDAQKKFLKLIDQLRKAMTQSFFKDIEKMVNEMSEGDIERMKKMVKDLNAMLVKKIAGEDPGFEDFMDKYGDMFGDNPPKSLDELLDRKSTRLNSSHT